MPHSTLRLPRTLAKSFLGMAGLVALAAACSSTLPIANGTSSTSTGSPSTGPTTASTTGALIGSSSSGGLSNSAGTSTSSSTGASTGSTTAAATGTASGTGSTTGATVGTTNGATNGTTGSLTGGTTGAPDSGSCNRTGTGVQFVSCQTDNDCACPLQCLTGASGSLVCEDVCQTTNDCPVSEDCVGGGCQLVTLCSLNTGRGENGSCFTNPDCICPFSCFGQSDGGAGACHTPCTGPADCTSDGQTCDTNLGYCVGARACAADGGAEFSTCSVNDNCQCPLNCATTLNGVTSSCQNLCQSPSDCTNPAEHCYLDAGICVPTVCSDNDAGSLFAGCILDSDCNCPARCVPDPAVGAVGSYAGKPARLCELCDGGNCFTIGGSCVADAGAPPFTNGPTVTTGGIIGENFDCTSNDQCICPDRCIFNRIGRGTQCRQPQLCTTSADCGPQESCVDGTCQQATCDFDASYPLGLPCNRDNTSVAPKGNADGTCLQGLFGLGSVVCTEAGSAGPGQPCNPSYTASSPLPYCVPGYVCAGLADGGNGCVPTCDPNLAANFQTGPNGCATGESCSAVAGPGLLPACVQISDAGCFVGDGLAVSPGALGSFSFSHGEFAACEGEADCACPLICQPGGLVPTCQLACQSDSDCANPLSSCIGGFCAESTGICTLGVNQVSDPCVTAAGSPGSCTLLNGFASFYYGPDFVCRRSGSATGGCDPQVTFCAPGEDCLPLPDDAGMSCQPFCGINLEASDGGTCPLGQSCGLLQTYFSFDFNTDQTGYPDVQGEGTCLVLSDAGCPSALANNEFSPCASQEDCACGLDCIPDPSLLVTEGYSNPPQYCEKPCQVESDCAPTYEICSGALGGTGHCVVNFCIADLNNDTEPSALGQYCNADQPDGGTCLYVTTATPILGQGQNFSSALRGIGLCYQGGTATTTCDPNADRSHPELLCPPGEICTPEGGRCTTLCDLPGNPGNLQCAQGQVCAAFLNPTYGDFFPIGYCAPPIP